MKHQLLSLLASALTMLLVLYLTDRLGKGKSKTILFNIGFAIGWALVYVFLVKPYL